MEDIKALLTLIGIVVTIVLYFVSKMLSDKKEITELSVKVGFLQAEIDKLQTEDDRIWSELNELRKEIIHKN